MADRLTPLATLLALLMAAAPLHAQDAPLPGEPEAQSVSDQQLTQAEASVTEVVNGLGSVAGGQPTVAQAAATTLNRAVQELQTALQYSQQHDQKKAARPRTAAAPTVATAAKKKSLPPVPATGAYAQSITALQGVLTTLEGADHDYGGHRVKAMHEIHEAMRKLAHRDGVRVHGGRRRATAPTPATTK